MTWSALEWSGVAWSGNVSSLWQPAVGKPRERGTQLSVWHPVHQNSSDGKHQKFL